MTARTFASPDLPTAPIVAAGLIGGFAVADATGIRPLGGVVLATAGLFAGGIWLRRNGAGVAAGLGLTYLAAFAGSHPLAKQIGAWPSVAAVSAVAAGAAYVLSDRR
ncbi:hypothetical protein [Nostocoides veronense]